MNPDFSNCLYFSTNGLSKHLSNMADEAFKAVGLAPSYAFLLMTVNDKPGIQPSEISSILQLTPSTITRLIEKMEYQGYLERNSEGRATHVTPTSKGKELDPEIRDAWQKLKDRYTEKLGQRYTEVLTEMSIQAAEKIEE